MIAIADTFFLYFVELFCFRSLLYFLYTIIWLFCTMSTPGRAYLLCLVLFGTILYPAFRSQRQTNPVCHLVSYRGTHYHNSDKLVNRKLRYQSSLCFQHLSTRCADKPSSLREEMQTDLVVLDLIGCKYNINDDDTEIQNREWY